MRIQTNDCKVGIRWIKFLAITLMFHHVSCLSTNPPLSFGDDQQRSRSLTTYNYSSEGSAMDDAIDTTTKAEYDFELELLMKLDELERESFELQEQEQKQAPIVDETQVDASSTTNLPATGNDNARINEEPKYTSLDDFTNLCYPYFESDAVRDDNRITNVEVADFFEHLCNELNHPTCSNTDIKFYSLDIPLQRKFIRIICPRDADGNPDNECLSKLALDISEHSEIAVEITPQTVSEVDRNMEIFCMEAYPLSTEYHYGSMSPSPYEPSSIPTSMPSPEPSSNPSSVPSPEPSPKPTPSPSASPTITKPTEPTVSPKPSTSPHPSYNPTQSRHPSSQPTPSPTSSPFTAQPTSKNKYIRSFTYMMGVVDDTNVIFSIVGGGSANGENEILDSTSNAIKRELTFLSPNVVRKGSSTSPDVLIISEPDGVQHKSQTEATCNDQIVESTLCIIIVSEVSLESNGKFTDEFIDKNIYPSMQQSMADGSLSREINRSEINEIVYLENGDNYDASKNEQGQFNNNESGGSLGGGAIAGITLSVLVCMIGTFCFAGYVRRRSLEDQSMDAEDRNLYIEDIVSSDDLYLDEEHFDDHDFKFISSYQDKMISKGGGSGLSKIKKGTKDSGIGDKGKFVSDNKGYYTNTFSSVLTPTKDDKRTKDDNLYLDEEHFQEDDLKFITEYQEQMEKGVIPTIPTTLTPEKGNEGSDVSKEISNSHRIPTILTTNIPQSATNDTETNLDTESSSDESEPNPETLQKSIEREDKIAIELSEAIHAGDWNKIAAFAGDDLSQDDDISALSSIYSRSGLSYDPSITRMKNSDAMEDSFLGARFT